MPNNKITLLSITTCLLISIAAHALPTAFSQMSNKIPKGIEVRPVNCLQGYFRNIKITPTERKCGFLAGFIDNKDRITESAFQARPQLTEEINPFAAKGEYITASFAVEILKPTKRISITTSPLTCHSNTISTSNLKVRQIINKKYCKGYDGDMLIAQQAENLKKSDVLHYCLFLHAPENVPAGVYTGKLTIKSDFGIQELAINFNILDFKLPAAKGSFGFYMPGHFAGQKCYMYRLWSPKSFTPANLVSLFKFWKTRGLNSPTLYHVYPEWVKENGKLVPKFDVIRKFAEAMNEAKLDGYLCIDCRFFGWYGEAKAKNDPSKPAEYYYRTYITKMLETADKENWPPLKLVPEEEVGNKDEKKKRTYARYWKILREIAGGRDYIVDNDIGYGRSTAIDRGNKHNFPVIQYNSWEDQALKNAHSNGRKVWAYNYGINRPSSGFLLNRIGGDGYHSWAEMWLYNDNKNWIHTAFMNDGIVASSGYEKLKNGIDDFRYMQLLKSIAEQLKAKGLKLAAEEAENVLTDVTKKIPVIKSAYQAYINARNDTDWDCLRWQIVLAIQKSRKHLGNPITTPLRKKTPKTPILLTAPLTSSIKQCATTNTLIIPVHESVKLDGMPDIKGKTNASGSLRRRVADEIRAHSFASSEEEYKTKIHCSYTECWVTYNSKGLILSIIANHGSSTNYNQAKYKDGDGNLWQDDCMEFFFKLPKQNNYYQLILNNLDQKVLIDRAKGQRLYKDISVFSKKHINPADALAQEIVIPWSYFGLDKMPEPGTAWQFNVCRSFFAFKQMMSWGRVYQSFHERDKWGIIKFSGKSMDSMFDKIKLGTVFPGNNTIAGEINLPQELMIKTLQLKIIDSNGKTIKEQAIHPTAKVPFSLSFAVPLTRQTKNWHLVLCDQETGKKLDSFTIVINGIDTSVAIENTPTAIISGQDIPLRINAKVSAADICRHPLKLRVVSKNKSIDLSTPLNKNGDNLVWLTTSGLEPGEWKLYFWLDHLGSIEENSSCKVNIFPY